MIQKNRQISNLLSNLLGEEFFQPRIVAAIVKMFGQADAVAGVFVNKRVLGQEPIQKDDAQYYDEVKDYFYVFEHCLFFINWLLGLGCPPGH